MRCHPASPRLALILVAVLLLAGVTTVTARPAGAEPRAPGPAYIPPVRPPEAIVVGHFRPPPTPYASGDRGVDYATVPGGPVVASAAGQVVFAGPVAGVLAITVRHADGLRTSYTFVASLAVVVGELVSQGQVIATTGPFLHVGVRDPAGRYLDPEALFAGRLGAHLVPGSDDGVRPLGSGPSGLAGEAQALAQMVGDGLALVGSAARAVGHLHLVLQPPQSLLDLIHEYGEWEQSQQGCTPASVPVPPPAGQRIAILVAGLGSTDRSASIDHVDTKALGYDAGDVVRFSYRGGRAAGRPAPPGGVAAQLDATSYGSPDTQTDLRGVADRLLALVAEVAERAPGVPIDLIAHSEGGVVVHLALIQGAARGALPGSLGTVVTISSPHQGADLATGLAAIRPSPGYDLALHGISDVFGLGYDPDATSLAQLSQTSDVTAEMAQPLPAGVHLLSIGAAGDAVVPGVRTFTPGAASVIVSTGGPNAHSDLPGSPTVTREIARAVAGQRPTCMNAFEGAWDIAESHGVARIEDLLGASLGP